MPSMSHKKNWLRALERMDATSEKCNAAGIIGSGADLRLCYAKCAYFHKGKHCSSNEGKCIDSSTVGHRGETVYTQSTMCERGRI